MPPSLLRWVFHSPLRLASVSLAVAVVVVGGVLVATSPVEHGAHAVARSAPSPHPVEPAPPLSTPTVAPAETVGTAERTAVTNASREFVNTWAAHGGTTPRSQWLRQIEPLTTHSLYRGLQATDPSALPDGRTRQVRLEQVGPFAATTTVTLTSGLQVQIALVAERGRWVVADLRPIDT